MWTKSTGKYVINFEKGEPYVFTDLQLEKIFLEQPHVKTRVSKLSYFQSRIPPFHVGAITKKGERVVFYNGAGGFGDQVMSWPVTKILHELGMKVSVANDPGNELCWDGVPWVEDKFLIPCHLSTMLSYPHHALFEIVTNIDEHPGQQHPIDTLLLRTGLNPTAFTRDQKVVAPFIDEARQKKMRDRFGNRPFGIFQLCSASPARSLSPDKAAAMVHLLGEEFPDLDWHATFDTFTPESHVEAAHLRKPDNVFVTSFETIHDLFASVSLARVVVAPDSLIMHLSGTLSIPTVGLWGQTDPDTRVCYYDKHVAITNKVGCPISPCMAHRGPEVPEFCPSKNRRVCCAVDDIELDAVVCAVRDFLT